MEPSKLQIPDPEKTKALRRIDIHGRVLVIAHIAAFVGTGITALALHPLEHLPRRPSIGAGEFTLIELLWFGWPFLASLKVSSSRLPGKTLSTVLFLILLVAVTIVGGLFLDTALANKEWGWDVFQIAVVEAVLLISGARGLAHMK